MPGWAFPSLWLPDPFRKEIQAHDPATFQRSPAHLRLHPRTGSAYQPLHAPRSALSVNVLMLIAVLSMLQATLTLPGIAAMALAIGVAIDSNVLINERIREELREGASPQMAIHTGYERAWATILDSNVTTLIAGLALLAFGSGQW